MNIDFMPVDAALLRPGERAPIDLYDAQGRLLLVKGSVITPAICQRAAQRSLYTLVSLQRLNPEGRAHNQHSAPIVANCPSHSPVKAISEDVHRCLVQSLRRIYKDAGLITPQQLRQTMEIVETILSELKGVDKLAYNFYQFEQYDWDTYAHSVNVAILTAALGLTRGYNDEKLRRLTLGAILHDIGKINISPAILHKPGTLTDLEFSLIKKHPLMGLERLKDVVLPYEVRCIIEQHHEKWDGTGYPNGLRGRAIHPFAQLVSIADVFDALISDRPYRQELPPYHAFEIVIVQTGTAFAEETVCTFKQCVVLYPEHSIVTLNTGEVGKVVAVPVNFPTRPLVKVLLDQYGKYLERDYYIDLMKELNRFIASIKFQPWQA